MLWNVQSGLNSREREDWMRSMKIGLPGGINSGIFKKKKPAVQQVFCCPTWIRTKTNSTKNCRTTIILSGNPNQYISVLGVQK